MFGISPNMASSINVKNAEIKTIVSDEKAKVRSSEFGKA
jgi:hypothetical protein